MVGFRHVAVLTQPNSVFVSNITDLAMGVVGGRLMLYSATQSGGGVGLWHLSDPDSAARAAGTHGYAGALRHMADPQVLLLDRPGGVSLLAGGLFGAADAARHLSANGQQGAFDAGMVASPLPLDLLTAGSFVTQGGLPMLFVARHQTPVFSLWRQLDNGRVVQAVSSTAPPGLPADAQIDALQHVRIGGADLIVSASTRGNFIAIHKVLPNGSLAAGEFLGSGPKAGFNGPRDIAAVEVAGRHYLIVSSAESSSLTTLRLLPGGQMVPVDHVIDELTTRFQRATVMKAASVDGRAFVVVGGADDGLSLFTITPDGRLIHLQTIEDRDGMSLANVSALAVRAIGGKLVVAAASATEPGISQFVIDPGRIGQTRQVGEGAWVGTGGNDLIQGGLNTTRINGGAGDDILIAGSRSIALTGGPGADVFVPLPVAGRVAIKDFELGVDRLDLSILGLIRSTQQLKFQPTAGGIRIRFGETLIDVESRDGKTLLPGMFDNAMFPIAHYQPPDVRTTVVGTSRGEVLRAARGGSTVWGYAGNDTIIGSQLEDHLIGGTGRDRILGNDGDDTIWADDGNDFVQGGNGNDTIIGGNGHDILMGDAGDDRISGGADNDLIWGGPGNDTLNGGSGHDWLMGDDGDDFLFGLAGDDRLIGGAGNDVMIDLEGDNVFRSDSGDNMMFGGPGRDRMFGGSGNDRMRPGAGNDFVAGGGGNDSIFAGDGADIVLGGDGDDLIAGGEGDDWLHGGAGNDFIEGGPGNDTLVGAEGDDVLIGNHGDDVLLGGDGNDTLRGGPGNDRIFPGAGNNRALGGTGDDTIIAGDGDDLLLGEGGRDLLGGGGGNDTLDGGWDDDDLYGHAGDDLLIGGHGNDTLRGGTGNDTLLGGEGRDLLLGGAGDDRLVGGRGNDTLWGGHGDDTLTGGEGADLMAGEAGADVFLWAAADESRPGAADRILSFVSGEDRLDLSALGLESIGTAAFSGKAGELRWTVGATGITIAADLDGDAVADFLVLLQGATMLSAKDFIL